MIPDTFRRFRPAASTLCALACAVLVLGACETLEEVRRSIGDWQPPEGTEAEAPPTPTGTPEGATVPPAEPAPGGEATPDEAGAGMDGEPGARAEFPPVPDASGNYPAPAVQLTPPPGVTPVTRVALLLPLSGEHEELGEAMLNAAELALFSISRQGFALTPVDTRGTPEGAAEAARVALDDGARLILGPLFAGSAQAVAPLARERDVPVISFSNDRAVAGDRVFIMGFTPETQVRRIIGYAHARGLQRLAGIVPTGPYGDRVAQAAYAAAAEFGLEIANIVRYAEARTETLSPLVRDLVRYDHRRAELKARLQALAGAGGEAARRAQQRLAGIETIGEVDFDGVLLPVGGAELRVVAPLLPFYDVDLRKVRPLGTMQWDEPSLATEPALFGGWFPAAPPRARTAFVRAYKSAFGAKPPRLASLAYDATALAAVLHLNWTEANRKRAAEGPVSPYEPVAPVFPVEALTASHGFAGMDGIFRLMPDGLVQRGLAVMEVRSRRFKVVSPAPRTFQRLGQ